MFQCDVCGSREFHEEMVNEIFNIEGKFRLVENIPAKACSRCGELTFSRETTEKIRQMLHENNESLGSIQVDIYAFNK